VKTGAISMEEAIGKSSKPDELQRLVGGVATTKAK
jgi:twitching motility protein PilT